MGNAVPLHPPMTADEVWARRDEFEGCEFVDGEVIEVSPTKKRPGRAESRIAFEFERHFDQQPESTADVVAGEVGYKLADRTVRAADCAVYLSATNDDDVEGWHTLAPDIIVEVLSPRDSWPDVERKIAEWHTLGAREVWIAQPKAERLSIRRPGQASVDFERDALVATPLLPGFSVPAWRLFRRR